MRRSARSTEAAISTLSAIIAARSPVVCITGAGISSSSGIPTFRGGSDSAVWDAKTLHYGTFASFSSDPLHWYNAFWLSGVIPWRAFYNAAPNAAHLAIAALASRFDVRVVTQNIDLLHRKGAGKVAEEKLILAHGRGEVYQCERYGHGCIGSRGREVDLWKFAAVNASRPGAGTEVNGYTVPPLKLERAPRCLECEKGVMRPACLMFDVGSGAWKMISFTT